MDEWARGDAPWSEVDADLVDLLRAGHREASRLGRVHGGDATVNAAYDAAAERLAWEGVQGEKGQAAYWEGLVQDVRNGRYGVPLDVRNPANGASLAARVCLYNRHWIATANDAWVDTEPEETLYEWRTTPTAEHCSDCAAWAAGGPYLVENLPAIPGDGLSQCRTGCGCFLKSDDGSEGFVLE